MLSPLFSGLKRFGVRVRVRVRVRVGVRVRVRVIVRVRLGPNVSPKGNLLGRKWRCINTPAFAPLALTAYFSMNYLTI